MAQPNTLGLKAKQMNTTPVELVRLALLETGSTLKAAAKLEVAPNTIRYWMLKGNLRLVTTTTADVAVGV